jgi:nicotinamidase-related amidase
LILVDYQPILFNGIGSGDKNKIKDNAIFAAKAATILDVPVVLSSINPMSNGNVFPELTRIIPEVFSRKVPIFDAFEDHRTYNAVNKTNRSKIVISGLWTSISFTYTALHAVKRKYDVYALIEAAGDSTLEAHDIGVKRMIQAGVIPVTLESLISEWMHDWDNTKSSELVNEVYNSYVSMIGLR